MKTAIETYIPIMRFGEEKAIKMIKDAGFDGIDFSFYWEGAKALEGDHVEYAKKIKDMLYKNNMVCVQAHAPFTFRYGMPFDTECDAYKETVLAIESAAIMGAKYIVVHGISVPLGQDFMDYNARFYKSLEKYAERHNIKIAIENLFSYDPKSNCCRGELHTPGMLCEMIKRLNSKSFVLCLDIGHAGVTGIEPDEMIKSLDKNVLRTLHVHDNDYINDFHLFPYHGSFNWDKIMSALKEINYEGDLTLEVMGQLEKYDTPLIPKAITLAGEIARNLTEKLER